MQESFYKTLYIIFLIYFLISFYQERPEDYIRFLSL